MPTRTGPPTAAGRWSLLPERETDATVRGHAGHPYNERCDRLATAVADSLRTQE